MSMPNSLSGEKAQLDPTHLHASYKNHASWTTILPASLEGDFLPFRVIASEGRDSGRERTSVVITTTADLLILGSWGYGTLSTVKPHEMRDGMRASNTNRVSHRLRIREPLRKWGQLHRAPVGADEHVTTWGPVVHRAGSKRRNNIQHP